MAQKSNGKQMKQKERWKRMALLGFVAVCVGLIGVIWADGLTADQPATPGYYRDSFDVDENIYLTVTAQATEYRQELEGTPTPDAHEEGEHHGSGQGQGQNEEHGGGNEHSSSGSGSGN